jgi:hypothetical protein
MGCLPKTICGIVAIEHRIIPWFLVVFVFQGLVLLSYHALRNTQEISKPLDNLDIGMIFLLG